MDPKPIKLQLRSANITEGKSRAPNRSMYYGMGYKETDFGKPMVGVANGHSTITPCNSGLQKLADAAVQGIWRPEATADLRHAHHLRRHGHGHRGHEVLAGQPRSHRRLHRDLRAGPVDGRRAGRGRLRQEHARRHDGHPAANVPAIYVYGGTILPGKWRGQDLNIVSVFEAVGQNAAGKISDGDLREIEQAAIPGTGSCGGMYTANTMSSAFEALGMSLPFSSTMANPHDEKQNSPRSRPRCCWKRSART